MTAIEEALDTVETLVESDHCMVARFTSPDAPDIAVYHVHLSDDADIYERAYACGWVPRRAECVEIISRDADWATDGGPGVEIIYRDASEMAQAS